MKMLQKYPEMRLSAAKSLKHKWFSSEEKKESLNVAQMLLKYNDG